MVNMVSFNQSSVVQVNGALIEEFKKRARENGIGRYRFCLQHSPKDKLHEMYIVRGKDDYMRPDKHLHTTESHTIVDGAMLVILFEDDGKIKKVFELSKEQWLTYRIDTDIYHMQLPLTEQAVCYEVKNGPFTEESNIFPEWAPDPHETEKVKLFMQDLKKRIGLI